jgi:hypothetical protein
MPYKCGNDIWRRRRRGRKKKTLYFKNKFRVS